MPMPSQDPIPKDEDFMSLCEICGKYTEDLEFKQKYGLYVCSDCKDKTLKKIRTYRKSFKTYKEARSFIDVVLKNQYGWNKWFGGNHSVNVVTTEWYCQCCKEEQTDGLPAYFISIKEGEVARVCSICFHRAFVDKINNLFDLIDIMRREPNFF